MRVQPGVAENAGATTAHLHETSAYLLLYERLERTRPAGSDQARPVSQGRAQGGFSSSGIEGQEEGSAGHEQRQGLAVSQESRAAASDGMGRSAVENGGLGPPSQSSEGVVAFPGEEADTVRPSGKAESDTVDVSQFTGGGQRAQVAAGGDLRGPRGVGVDVGVVSDMDAFSAEGLARGEGGAAGDEHQPQRTARPSVDAEPGEFLEGVRGKDAGGGAGEDGEKMDAAVAGLPPSGGDSMLAPCGEHAAVENVDGFRMSDEAAPGDDLGPTSRARARHSRSLKLSRGKSGEGSVDWGWCSDMTLRCVYDEEQQRVRGCARYGISGRSRGRLGRAPRGWPSGLVHG